MFNLFKKKGYTLTDHDVESILEKKGILKEGILIDGAKKIGIKSIAFSENAIPQNAIEELKKNPNIIVEENGRQFLGLNEIMVSIDPNLLYDNIANFCSIVGFLIAIANNNKSSNTMLTVKTTNDSFSLKAKDAVEYLFKLMRKE
ncbi:MAG: hypothetical protein MJZ45_04240 [Bacteroidales bacterium]|nr:hypothetical protein [Bacteroidales bacterium]